jgi:hypothetical protein
MITGEIHVLREKKGKRFITMVEVFSDQSGLFLEAGSHDGDQHIALSWETAVHLAEIIAKYGPKQ